MELNYLILAHNDLSQLDRLINVLKYPDTHFFIHIDKRISMQTIRSYSFYESKNVIIVRKRFEINWAGFNMIRATLSLMKAATASKRPGYCVLLSGQDFPLQVNEHIYGHLAKNYGKEYIKYSQFPHESWQNGGYDRIQYYWFIDKIGIDDSIRLVYYQKESRSIRPYFTDFFPYGGSQWWCLTHECVTYILKFLNRNPVFMDYYELTFIPDESFFQTIVLNSSFKTNTVNNNLRYIVFDGNNAHPNIIRESDYFSLLTSNQLWARKFDQKQDNEVLNKLEAHLANRKG